MQRRYGIASGLTVCLILTLAFSTMAFPRKASEPALGPELFQALEWRHIGPAIMSGRLTDIEGVPGHPEILYVASASGGLWKTTNGGITWEPIFDRQPTISIGDIAIDPNNPDVIWVGTGEDNPRNSTSFGTGVYRSTDGGKTWEHMGLEETERISRIVIHPHNPNIVYVAAVGHVFGPDPNRGVYMTTDGGKTWKKVLYIDEYHGASDLEIDPRNPNILYAGMWYFQRKPWTFTSGSEKGGLYRSIDGGKTWKKVTQGLPKLMGRIGVKVAPSNPNIVYVIAEAREEDGILFRSEDRGETFKAVYKKFNIVSRGFYYTELRVDPENENRVYAISSRLYVSEDGGKTFERVPGMAHGDFHTLWIDPTNPNFMWAGDDGGLFRSFDRGKHWDYINNLPVSQFYQINVDNREPFYYVCGGLQDNGTWCGPSRTYLYSGILNDFWYLVSYGDGYHVVIHPDNPELYVSEYQGGGIMRTNLRTGEQQDISPQPRRNDGGPVQDLKYRFNWNAPIIASPHDPKTIYFGGNVVFKSTDFGSTWEVISPDLTTNDPEKQKSAGGPIYPENTTAEYHCTITMISESPVQPGIIWVGTDDGNVQVTRDGGKTWTNVVKNIKGLPPNSPVSHVEASRTGPGVAYVTFDRHMFDDFRPYIYKTTDFGKSWRPLHTGPGLPEKGYVHVLREDPRNPNVLYLGTEVGLYVSFDGGASWMKLHMKNLPNVAVHDIVVHPRDNDLVIGTHGRGIWILDDVTFLQEISREVVQQPVYLFTPRPALRYAQLRVRAAVGNRAFRGKNPPYGALLTYYLKEEPKKDTEVKIEILDTQGNVIRTLKDIPKKKGLNRTHWDLRMAPVELPKELREQLPMRMRELPGPQVLPGTYRVRLVVGDHVRESTVEVRLNPLVHTPAGELQRAFEIAARAHRMLKRLLDVGKLLAAVRMQVQPLKRIGLLLDGKPPKEVTDVIERVLKRIDEIEGRIRRKGSVYWAQPPRLAERLGYFVFTVDRTYSAPTPYQVEYFRELQQEYASLLQDVRTLLQKDIPELEQTLQQHDIPVRILLPKKVQDILSGGADTG